MSRQDRPVDDAAASIERPDMTPMIDVVFQLLVFFLVTMQFKTLDYRIETFLPKDRGPNVTMTTPRDVVSIDARVVARDGRAVVKSLGRVLGFVDDEATWERLTETARAVRARHLANAGHPEDVEAEIDADRTVPTGSVVRALDAFVEADVTKITFRGAPNPGSVLHELRRAAETR